MERISYDLQAVRQGQHWVRQISPQPEGYSNALKKSPPPPPPYHRRQQGPTSDAPPRLSPSVHNENWTVPPPPSSRCERKREGAGQPPPPVYESPRHLSYSRREKNNETLRTPPPPRSRCDRGREFRGQSTPPVSFVNSSGTVPPTRTSVSSHKQPYDSPQQMAAPPTFRTNSFEPRPVRITHFDDLDDEDSRAQQLRPRQYSSVKAEKLQAMLGRAIDMATRRQRKIGASGDGLKLVFAKEASVLSSSLRSRSSPRQRTRSVGRLRLSRSLELVGQEGGLNPSERGRVRHRHKDNHAPPFKKGASVLTSLRTRRSLSLPKRTSSLSQESLFHDSDSRLVHIPSLSRAYTDSGRITSTINNPVAERSSCVPKRTPTEKQRSSFHNSDPRLLHIALDGRKVLHSKVDTDSGRITSTINNQVTERSSCVPERTPSAKQESSFHDSDPRLVRIPLDENKVSISMVDSDSGRITSTKDNQVAVLSSCEPKRTSFAKQVSSFHDSDSRLVQIPLDGRKVSLSKVESTKDNQVAELSSCVPKRASFAKQESSFHDSDPRLVHIALNGRKVTHSMADADSGRIASAKDNQVAARSREILPANHKFDVKTGRCKKHPSIIIAKKSHFRKGCWDMIKAECPLCSEVESKRQDKSGRGDDATLKSSFASSPNNASKFNDSHTSLTNSLRLSNTSKTSQGCNDTQSLHNPSSTPTDRRLKDLVADGELCVRRMPHSTPWGESGWYTGAVDSDGIPHGRGRMRTKTGNVIMGTWTEGYPDDDNLERRKGKMNSGFDSKLIPANDGQCRDGGNKARSLSMSPGQLPMMTMFSNNSPVGSYSHPIFFQSPPWRMD